MLTMSAVRSSEIWEYITRCEACALQGVGFRVVRIKGRKLEKLQRSKKLGALFVYSASNTCKETIFVMINAPSFGQHKYDEW